MGFLKKAWNWITGKGYLEDEEIQLKKAEQQEQSEALERAETLEPKQREEIQEQTQTIETQPEIRTEEKPIKPKPTTTPKSIEETTNATKRFQQSGNIAQAQERLSGDRINEITFTPTNDLNSLRNTYENLLRKSRISTTDKYGNEDKALIDILIENREKLQHRFTAEITIHTNKGQATMSIDGILAEHLNGLYDYIQIGS